MIVDPETYEMVAALPAYRRHTTKSRRRRTQALRFFRSDRSVIFGHRNHTRMASIVPQASLSFYDPRHHTK
jgi:hypothetical protein